MVVVAAGIGIAFSGNVFNPSLYGRISTILQLAIYQSSGDLFDRYQETL
jgi:hypothetical protein